MLQLPNLRFVLVTDFGHIVADFFRDFYKRLGHLPAHSYFPEGQVSDLVGSYD